MATASFWDPEHPAPLLARCTAYLVRQAERRAELTAGSGTGAAAVLVSRACRYAHRMADRINRLQQLLPDTSLWQPESEPHFGRWLKARVVELELAQQKAVAALEVHRRQDQAQRLKKDKDKARAKRDKACAKPAPAADPTKPDPVAHWSKVIQDCERRVQECKGSTPQAIEARCDAMAVLAGTVAALIGLLGQQLDGRAVIDSAVKHLKDLVQYSALRKRSPRALLANVCTALLRCRTVQNGAGADRIPSGFLHDLMMLACDATELAMMRGGGEPPEFAHVVLLSVSLGTDTQPSKGTRAREVVARTASTGPLLNRLADLLSLRNVTSNRSVRGKEALFVAQTALFWAVSGDCYDLALAVSQEKLRDTLPLDYGASPEKRKEQEVARACAGLCAQIMRDTGIVRLACKTADGATTRDTLLATARLLDDATRLFRYESRNLLAGRRADAIWYDGLSDGLLTDCKPLDLLGRGRSRPPDAGLLPDLLAMMTCFSGFHLVQAMCLAYRVLVVGSVTDTAVGVLDGSGPGTSVRISSQAQLRFTKGTADWIRDLERVLLPCLARVGAELDNTRIPGEETLPEAAPGADNAQDSELQQARAEYEARTKSGCGGPAELEKQIDDDGFFVGPVRGPDCWPTTKTLATHLGEHSFVYKLFHLYYDTMVTQLLVCEKGCTQEELAARRANLAAILARERVVCSSPLAAAGAPSCPLVVRNAVLV